jgi:hypothetical protein
MVAHLPFPHARQETDAVRGVDPAMGSRHELFHATSDQLTFGVSEQLFATTVCLFDRACAALSHENRRDHRIEKCGKAILCRPQRVL